LPLAGELLKSQQLTTAATTERTLNILRGHEGRVFGAQKRTRSSEFGAQRNRTQRATAAN